MFKAVIWLPYIFFSGFLLTGLIWVWIYIPGMSCMRLGEASLTCIQKPKARPWKRWIESLVAIPVKRIRCCLKRLSGMSD